LLMSVRRYVCGNSKYGWHCKFNDV